jgi:predicted MPP superfamily phosphohydrolase
MGVLAGETANQQAEQATAAADKAGAGIDAGEGSAGRPSGEIGPCPERDAEGGRESTHLTRRTFLGAAAAAALSTALYAGEIARHELVTERRAIAIEHLPESFSGFRIAQISDFHFAAYTEPFYMRRVVERVNALRPDLLLLTGDFISMAPIERPQAAAYAPLCAALLASLDCPLRYGVLGNHDWMVNAAAVTESLNAVGIRILDNEYLPLERDGKRIWLAGVADALSPAFNLRRALPPHALTANEPVILMCHEPDVLDVVAATGVDLMLSGHTHGGQVRLPFVPPLFLPPLGKLFIAGHFTRRRTQLYVNRGIGAVGLPFRFNCPSEITEITLRPA